MELILNRIKYNCKFDGVKIILSYKPNKLANSIQWKYFIDKFSECESFIIWAKENKVNKEERIMVKI